MALSGLDWQAVNIPFAAGLDLKAQPQALEPPGLVSALNVEFDEVGGLRLRKPYASIGANIYGGGTLSNVRKIAVVGDELLAFTSTLLYSWSETLTAWVSKGTHLAVATTEATRFSNTSDQSFADRAQLSGTVVLAWVEVLSGTASTYLAAFDATTGAITLSPVSFGAGNTRPRVVALSTKILVFWTDAGVGLVCKAIDPAAPAFTSSGATTVDPEEGYYDVVKDPGADRAVYVVADNAGGFYTVGRVTAALAVTSSVKVLPTTGCVAVSVAPAAADSLTVVREILATGVIKADIITLSTLADATINTTVGTGNSAGVTPLSQLTAAHRSVTNGGAYRCYVFWCTATSATAMQAESNWIDTTGAIGTENDTFLAHIGIASRAFDYNGTVYVWGAFAEPSTGAATGVTISTSLGIRGQLQNTYYLFADDETLVAKAATARAGGYPYYTNHLPGVALISGTTGYAWAGIERQLIVLGGTDQTGYSARAPRDITFTFDSDDARRVVQLGRTAYVSGSILLQYDGENLTEVGFEQVPWSINASVTAAGSTIPAGAYSYKSTLRWDNARGETERSTTAIGVQVTIAANDQVNLLVAALHVTRKRDPVRAPAIEIWRTKVSPVLDSPFYLVTSRDPSTTGDNAYLANDPDTSSGVSLNGDVFTDAVLETKEQSPDNGAALPHMVPPGATIITASDTRMFLAGIPGEPYRVRYSLQRGENEVVAFHDALAFSLPATTGAVTGLALLNDTLVVFTASAVYVVPGDGYDNTGGGSNYGTPRVISSDVGALSHDTITVTPTGLVFFSRKGWYRLSGGWDLEYIGAPVEDYNTDTWVAAQVVESQHQVRLLSSSRMLMWDYLVNQWSEWSQSSGKALARWRTYPMLLDTAVKKEQSTFSAVDYLMDVETGWIKVAGMQGFARIRRIMVLGEFKQAHKQRMRVRYDYNIGTVTTPTYTDDASMSFSSSVGQGSATQFRQGPSRQRCEAIRVRITIYDTDGTSTPAFDAVTLTGLAFEFGLRRGLYPRLPAAQKQ